MLIYSKIIAILSVLYFCFYTFLFNLGKQINKCEKNSFSLLYLTLVTSCIIIPFLCCHLLYLIIFLVEPVWWISKDYPPYLMFIMPGSLADIKTGLWYIYICRIDGNLICQFHIGFHREK